MYIEWASLEIGRVRRSKTVKLINVNEDATYAECKGSGKEPYIITDESCTCTDCVKTWHVCKHMIALAALRGDIDVDAIIEEDDVINDTQACVNRLGAAFAAYYLFKAPIMSDDEYDELKKEFLELKEKYESITGKELFSE